MKALVIYDSAYGNTALVARIITHTLGETMEARRALVSKITPAEACECDILVVGSPTQAGRSTAAIQQFLSDLPAGALDGRRAAAFDTRFAKDQHGIKLQILMSAIGFAAGKIAHTLKAKGAVMLADGEGFIVKDMEGPLKPGEIERAASWARGIALRADTALK